MSRSCQNPALFDMSEQRESGPTGCTQARVRRGGPSWRCGQPLDFEA
jgi:hypothetical protein